MAARQKSRSNTKPPPINVRIIHRQKHNVRIYILCHNEERLKLANDTFGQFYWAFPIRMKYQNCTFENAFWKQLLEIKDEWIGCDMVGTLSSKAASKIDVRVIHNIVHTPSMWSCGYYNFNLTENAILNDPHILQIMHDVCTTLGIAIPGSSCCNYWMCRPALMVDFIGWFENTLKPVVLAHPLIMTDAKYFGQLKKHELLSLCGTPFYPHAPFVFEQMNKAFFDGCNIVHSELLHNPKAAFRHFCARYLKYIRLFTIPPILRTCKKEAVLIEYRQFPHLEFLLRNMILKLGVDWSYTVVCGTLNYGLMRTMCTNIHPNINLIVTPYDNLTPSLYSTFLASADFWNMLHGEKILIYQEDSIVFNTNINDFLQWDYIGAPWPRHQNDTPNGVGNGGFSLRTRKVMLDVISRKTIADTLPNKSTLEYMTNTISGVLPEDVYFSKNIQELGLGKVAPWHVAYDFSTETQYNPNSLGGHNFWINDSQWKNRLYKNIVINYACKTKLKTTHRGGWEYILNTMKEHNILDPTSENEFLSVTEEVYLWHNYELRPKNRWIGFIHCTPIAPEYLDVINISFLPKSTMFLEDIERCDGLYCLSEYVSEYLRKNIPNPPRIITLMHPVVFDDIPLFTMEKYEANSDKYILQIGQQLRKVTSIFKISVSGFKRLWLTGNPDMNQCKEMIIREGGSGDYSILHYTKTFKEYDEFLEKNIVFIDLFDSAANNTVLECIVRNTPIILNRTPGVIEYLGADYPLYFDHLDEVAGLMAIDKLAAAYRYLKLMNKDRFTIDYFMRAFVNSIKH
jgi:hypothetical protein